ncbi:MAG: hypothetical protein ACJ73S_13960 [Mycobacteriales bacterium]
MPQIHPRWAALAAAAVVAAALPPGDRVATAAPGGPPPAPPGAVLLPTGEQVTVGPDGGPAHGAVLPATTRGPAGVLLTLGIGGRTYELPATALPYLNNGLDPALFDVATLATVPAATLPVTISYQGAPPSLPGVTVTRSGGGTADGYLTAASARDFGAALAAQFLDDRAHGGYGGRGLFAAGTAISLAGHAPAAPAAHPMSVMHTLAVTATDAAGQPDQNDPVLVYNVDDSRQFSDVTESENWFADGEARFSVPEGHYAALALFFDLAADGTVTGVREVARPEFAVTGDRTVNVAATEASSQVTMVTPRPAVAQDGGFVFRRTATTGPSLYIDLAVTGGAAIRIAPTATPVSVGGLETYPYQRLTSPPDAKVTPYEYQLQYATSGVIPAQRYVVRPGDLATVDAGYYSDVPATGVRQRAAEFPWERDEEVLRYEHPLALPRRQTEYVSGDASLVWFGGLAKFTREYPGGFLGWYGGQYETAHGYRPGQRVTEDWNRFPLHPAGAVALLGAASPWTVRAPATRAGDLLRLDLTPFSDNQPGHTGFGYYGQDQDAITGSYAVSANGVTIASGDPTGGRLDFATEVTLPADPSTVRLVLDAGRGGPNYPLSTATHTEWTWRSAHTSGRTLAAPLACEPNKGGPPDRDCAAEPLLTLSYAVDRLAVDGSAAGGRQGLDLTVGHLQQAAGGPVTGATVQYSTDDGATWHDTTVTRCGGGTFRASFTAAGPGYVSLRVHAADGAGGEITETVQRAYRLTGGAS